MPEGKRKYIEDCARVIDGRVRALRKELEDRRDDKNLSDISRACDRSAIAEAELLASLIRQLDRAPYVNDPYEVARLRRDRHGDIYSKDRSL